MGEFSRHDTVLISPDGSNWDGAPRGTIVEKRDGKYLVVVPAGSQSHYLESTRDADGKYPERKRGGKHDASGTVPANRLRLVRFLSYQNNKGCRIYFDKPESWFCSDETKKVLYQVTSLSWKFSYPPSCSPTEAQFVWSKPYANDEDYPTFRVVS